MALPIDQQNIIKILGLEALPQERRVEILERVTDLVEKRLLLRLFEALTEDKQGELRTMLDREESDKLAKFLQNNAPQMADWAMEEASKVKKELAGLVK
ncbi:MAG: DUF5663 domain-containing protein [bacterium]|nr:DUF5663 domain-containing protein [bacterium]